MRIIAKKTLREYWEVNKDAQEALSTWYNVITKEEFITIQAVTQRFPRSSLLKNNRIVFRIKGNHYRLKGFSYKKNFLKPSGRSLIFKLSFV